jgi:hypothetical protein
MARFRLKGALSLPRSGEVDGAEPADLRHPAFRHTVGRHRRRYAFGRGPFEDLPSGAEDLLGAGFGPVEVEALDLIGPPG